MQKLLSIILPVLLLSFVNSNACFAKGFTEPDLDIQKIQKILNLSGQYDAQEQVFKISFVTLDRKVTVTNINLTQDMGITSWVAFKKANNKVLVMGDLVLLADQVNPVMSSVLDNGLYVTALHNHFLWENPRIMFMHIEGMSNEIDVATKINKIIASINSTKDIQNKSAPNTIDIAKSTLNPALIDAILQTKGQFKNGVYKAVFGRVTRMQNIDLGKVMGVNTWAAFAGSDNQSIVDGDFAVYENELQRVLAALRQAGINIVSIHQHMLGEKPRIIFIHYWGMGGTEKLAKGLHAALLETKNN